MASNYAGLDESKPPKGINTVVMLEDFVSGGTGLYTIREAARYARMSPVTLSRWFKGGNAGDRIFNTLEDGEKVITFLDFVQALAVRNLRANYNIKLQTIRDAVERASQEHKLTYPFACLHKTYVFDGKLWIQLQSKELVELSGHGQKGMLPVIEPFMKDVVFDSVTCLATRYQAFKRNEIKILMDPKLRFGEPMLENVGYTPGALFEAAKTEGSAQAVAKLYGVSVEQVEVCIDYFDHLQAA